MSENIPIDPLEMEIKLRKAAFGFLFIAIRLEDELPMFSSLHPINKSIETLLKQRKAYAREYFYELDPAKKEDAMLLFEMVNEHLIKIIGL